MGKGDQIDFLSGEFHIKEFLVKINKLVNHPKSRLLLAPHKTALTGTARNVIEGYGWACGRRPAECL